MKSRQERNFEIKVNNGLFKARSLRKGYEDVGFFFEITYIQELREVGTSALVAKEMDDTYTIYLVEYMDNQGKPKKINIYKLIADVENYWTYDDSLFVVYMRGYFQFFSIGRIGVAPALNDTKHIINQRVMNLKKIKGEKIQHKVEFNNLSKGRYVFLIDETYYLIEMKGFALLEGQTVEITELGQAEPMDVRDCIIVRDDDSRYYIHEGYSKGLNITYRRCNQIAPLKTSELEEIYSVCDGKNTRGFYLLEEDGIIGLDLYDADTDVFPAKFYEIALTNPVKELKFRKRIVMSGDYKDYIDFWGIVTKSGEKELIVKTPRGMKTINSNELI